MKSYSEKLKDPRWQKKRLKKLEAANWKCQFCHSHNRTLHVHHGYYGKEKEPWDYPDDTLHVLCEDCHERAELEREALYSTLARMDETQINLCYNAFRLVPTAHLFYFLYGLWTLCRSADKCNLWPIEKVVNGEWKTTEGYLQWFQERAVQALVEHDLELEEIGEELKKKPAA